MPSSNPKVTLKALLEGSTPGKIQACLLKSLDEASITEQEALLALLAPLNLHAGIALHCVRCHDTYTENKNHSNACRIKHGSHGDAERTETGDDAMTTTLACCGISFDSEEEPPTKYCFMAPHTTDVADVIYYDEADDIDDLDGVNENVISCKSLGCSRNRKRKAVKDGGATTSKNGSSKKQK